MTDIISFDHLETLKLGRIVLLSPTKDTYINCLIIINMKNTLQLINIAVLLKSFQQCSGLKINIDKRQSKYIGSLSNNDYYPHGLSWIKTPCKTLGIVITIDDELNYIHNFQQRILNLKSILNIWKQRKLSLKGTITNLNNIALSPIICTSSVVDTSTKAINEINSLIQAFIWHNSTSKIAQNTLKQKIEKRGFKAMSFSYESSHPQIIMDKKAHIK